MIVGVGEGKLAILYYFVDVW